jgi:hypothetical protein
MSELTKLESEALAEVNKVETEAKTVAKEVETKTEAVVEKVETAVKKALVEITIEEKLFLRETELEYLKVTMEIQRLQKIVEADSKKYMDSVEVLLKKYGLDKAEYIFDGTVAAFKKIEAKL